MVLTLDDAQHLVRGILDGSGGPDVTILPEFTIERPFGWVFMAAPASDGASHVNPAAARIFIVNKYSRDILGTSTGFFVQNCIATYEAAAKANRQDWCLTLSPWGEPTRAGAFRSILEKVGLTVLAASAKSSDI